MSHDPLLRSLPEHPDIDQLRRQAKELLAAFNAGEKEAAAEVHRHFHDADPARFALHDAQLVTARSYGFESWPKLKARIDGVNAARLCDAVERGDIESVRSMLRRRPEIVNFERPNQSEHRALHIAVMRRDLAMVKILMAHGANPNSGIWPYREETSPLMLAIGRGYDEIVAAIRGKEPQPHRPATPTLSPELTSAWWRGDEPAVIALLEEHPDLIHYHHHHDGMTILQGAAAMLQERLVVWLLDHGAEVNARTRGGATALGMIGCAKGAGNTGTPEQAASIEKILLDHGAERTVHWAIATGRADWLRTRHAQGTLKNPPYRDNYRRGLVELAVFYNRTDMVEFLIDLGFNPDEPMKKDGTDGKDSWGGPLQFCIDHGRTPMADLLLKRGATLSPHAAIALGKTDWLRARHAEGKLRDPDDGADGLLYTAIKQNRHDMLILLLDLGFDPNEPIRDLHSDDVSYSRGRPLEECASSGKHAMAQLLLEHGADPNGWAAMWSAYRARDSEMIRLLERFGSVPNAATPGYLRDTELAAKMFAGEAAGRLPKGTVPPGRTVAEEILDPAASAGSTEIVRMALDRINWPRDDPRWFGILASPLCFWNHIPWIYSPKWDLDRSAYIDSFRLILKRCDPNVWGAFGMSVLHYACASYEWVTPEERVPFVSELLDAGARLDARDTLLRSTPLGWACRWGRTEIVKLLLARGADPIEKAAEPWATPKAWARKMGHQTVLAQLEP